jgi:hypothetical protein
MKVHSSLNIGEGACDSSTPGKFDLHNGTPASKHNPAVPGTGAGEEAQGAVGCAGRDEDGSEGKKHGSLAKERKGHGCAPRDNIGLTNYLRGAPKRTAGWWCCARFILSRARFARVPQKILAAGEPVRRDYAIAARRGSASAYACRSNSTIRMAVLPQAHGRFSRYA